MKVNISECNSPVAENIVRITKEKGIKQKFIAEKIGLPALAISDMVHGRKLIKVNDIVQIAAVLEVEVECLFQEEGGA